MKLLIRIWDPDEKIFVDGTNEMSVDELCLVANVIGYSDHEDGYPNMLVVWVRTDG